MVSGGREPTGVQNEGDLGDVCGSDCQDRKRKKISTNDWLTSRR
jgi:hypothetical protein